MLVKALSSVAEQSKVTLAVVVVPSFGEFNVTVGAPAWTVKEVVVFAD